MPFLYLTFPDAPFVTATAEACADYCVSLFSDLTKYVTMQNLFHDGGFSFTGVSEAVVKQMEGSGTM